MKRGRKPKRLLRKKDSTASRCPQFAPSAQPQLIAIELSSPTRFTFIFNHMLARTCLCLVILLGSSAGALLGLDPGKHIDQYGHDSWTSQQGLPGEAVYQILQTQDGYLWMRTSEGLVRFDGVRFVAMDNVAGGAVRAIASSAEGDLLIRTNLRTLLYKNGAFSDYLLPRPLPDGDIKTLLETNKHEVFVGSDDFIYLTRNDGIRMLLEGTGHVDAMVEDDSGKVWFGGAYGLYSYLDGVLSTAIDAKTMSRYGAISALVGDHRRNLWLGTSTGLYRMANNSPALVLVAPAAIHGRLHTILDDHQGNRWIGSERGLLRLTGDQDSSFTVADGLTDNTVLSLFEDREGSLWVGTASGLDRFRNTKVTTLTVKEGLPSNDARAVIETREGSLYAFCIPGGLARITDDEATEVTNKEGLSFQGDGVFESKDGSLWLGTQGGLTRFKDGKFTVYDPDHRFSAHFISSISEDNEGLIVTTAETIALRFGEYGVRPFTIDGKTTPLSRPGNYTFTIYRDLSGTLWFGTVKGLFRFAAGEPPGNARRPQINFPVTSISDDHRGSLWLGGRTDGLTRFRIADGRVTRYRKQDGLFDGSLSRVLFDGEDNLWISSAKGIYMARRKDMDDFADGLASTVPAVVYGTYDGMKTSEASSPGSQPAGWRTGDGRLWFTTVKGIVVVDPSHILHNDKMPPVVIESVVVNDRSMPSGNDLTIAPGKDQIEFHYTGLSLRIPARVRFKYRLEGFDRDWVDAGPRRVAYYTNLPPGNYRFRVIACNDDGVWNEEGASVGLHLQPHFYQTGWFSVLLGLTATLVIVGGQRLYTRRLRTRGEELAGMVEERTKDLKAAEQTADSANRAKSEFLATMSHEIRTPLNGVIGMTELAMSSGGAEQQEYLSLIKSSGQDLLFILNDILDYSKIEAGKITLESEPFRLEELVGSAVKSMASAAHKKGLELTLQLARDVPSDLLGDGNRLRQVLLNLIGNAIKFTASGEVSVAVSVAEAGGDRPQLHFAVRDTGIGLSLEQQSKVFRPFEQANSSTTRQYGGTGLGLAISSRLVELMEGEIWIESALGEGATFHFTVRLVKTAPTATQIALGTEREEAPPTISAATLPPGGSLDILVAEDNHVNQRIAVAMLEKIGHRVTLAANGVQAVAQWAQGNFDLIFMDVHMPELDGLDATRRIRSKEQTHGTHIAIIAMTANAMSGDRERCIASGMDDYISKPISRRSIEEAIERLDISKRE